MGKCINEGEKAESHRSKAEYWEKKANSINLSMPESIDYYDYLLQQAIEKHKELLTDVSKRTHSYSLTYAKKAVNEAQKNLDLAIKLWK